MANVTKSSKTFEEITGNTINPLSQIRLFNILKDNEIKKEFLNIFRTYVVHKDNFNKIMNYKTYEISNDDWWDNVGYDYYNTVLLWWLIPLINEIQNPFEDVEPGENLRTLKKEYIPIIMGDLERLAQL